MYTLIIQERTTRGGFNQTNEALMIQTNKIDQGGQITTKTINSE